MRLAAVSQGSCCLPRAALQPANRLPLGRAAPAPLRFHSSSGSLLAGRRPAHGGSFRRRAAAVAPACALPEEAFSKVVDALKEVHTKPTDREVVAVGEAAAAAAASTAQHVAATSKTVSGYLLHEAPVRTWLPLLGCSVAAAVGAYMRQRRLEWAALGGIMSFVFTVWQVLAPLVRRLMALRTRLLDNDRAAKKRLDLAVEHLNKAAGERGRARQEAQQAWGEVRRLKHAIAATVAAAGGLWPPISGNGNVAGGAGAGSGYSSSGESYAATAVEQAALRLEALRGMLEERREQDKRLLGVLNNALNAAAVPNILAGEHGCTDTPDDATDGFGERPIDRDNAMELAGALQGRVDALRRQIMEAAEAQEAAATVRQRAEAQQSELVRLHAELRERTDEAAALQAQLEIAKAEVGRLPQLQERLQSLERQLARLSALQTEREGLQAKLARLQSLEGQTAELQRQLAEKEAELAAEREWRASSGSDGSGPEGSDLEEDGGEAGSNGASSPEPGAAAAAVGQGNGAAPAAAAADAAGESGAEAAQQGEPEPDAEAAQQEPGPHPEAAAAAAAATTAEPAAAHRTSAAAAPEGPFVSTDVLSRLLGLAVAAGAATAAAASREGEHQVVAELDTVRHRLHRAERFLQAYDKAVPALADRLMALQAQHEQLERTQAELVAQHEADEAAGSKCLELAEAVLAAAHDVEDEMGSSHQPAPAESGEDAREAELGQEAPAAGEGSGAERNGVVPDGAAEGREGEHGGSAVAEEQPADGRGAE